MNENDYLSQIKQSFGSDLVLVGVTGSRLYGNYTEDSDWDFIVVSSAAKKNSHSIVGDLDVKVVSVENWVYGVNNATPQFLEVLYSSRTQWFSPWQHLCQRASPGTWAAKKYLLHFVGNAPQGKINAHLARRALMWLHICEYGFMRPELDEFGLSLMSRCAENDTLLEQVLELAESTMIGDSRVDQLLCMR